MDTNQKVFEWQRRNVAETARRVVCTLGTAAELLIAAGGDAPAQAGVVTMYGLRTGVAIVGWWIVAAVVGKVIGLFQAHPVWHACQGDVPVIGRGRFPWGQLVLYLLVIVGIVTFRIWMPVSLLMTIHQ